MNNGIKLALVVFMNCFAAPLAELAMDMAGM